MTITADQSARAHVPIGAAIPSLVRWGLSSDADLVFRTLATFGPRTQRALVAELGLPGRRTAEALAELRESEAAFSADDGPTAKRIWTARPPANVVAVLRARRMRLVDLQVVARSHHAVVRSLRETSAGSALPLATAPGSPGLIANGIRYLATRGIARRRLGELLGGEVREFLSMSNEQAFDAESARAASPLDLSLYERGVQTRMLGVPPADGDPLDVSGHLINGTFFQRREALEVPLKLIVIDRRVSLFPADPHDLERGYLEVSQPGVVQALVDLFDQRWNAALPGPRTAIPVVELTARERTLITLLATGHTDQSAASLMRISARSVTATMRKLMDRLGVENRFQLGLALGTLRVATPPSLASATDETLTPPQES